MTPTRPINISKDTNNLPASPKAGVRPRLDPTVLKAEVHSKTKANSEALKNNSNSFTIPFNRQELADFLSVERSAMSAELSRMQKDKLITYHKNNFTLL